MLQSHTLYSSCKIKFEIFNVNNSKKIYNFVIKCMGTVYVLN